ncbi:MAG: nuclear transport factor 2 family protein [Candidatus Eremiobacteraeota bacterium]|nr:nuclear transport factor 2 family protein [Candidatus Eremiobacteraeota bacterium]
MDFVDSFTNLKQTPPAPLVAHFYDLLNRFLDGQGDEFLDLWHESDESTLYFNLDERERTADKIRLTFKQIRAVLSRVPVGTTLSAVQVSYHECADMAYAVLMEEARSDKNREQIVSEQRVTLVWRRVGNEFKVVHMHTDYYNRRTELLSELLRAYHPNP